MAIPRLFGRIGLFMHMIKFEHTIFALPYAYIGMIMASFYKNGTWPGWATFFWITLAMVGARSAAMALNRLIDKQIDARNPRTADRELPRGAITDWETMFFIIGSFGVLGISAWMLNPLCLILMPVAVAVLVLYPYTKRFTWACHLVLGIADGLAPLGAWIAVTGHFDVPGLLLAAAVAAWISAFDIIYACQDVEFDRQERLHSIPSRFGVAGGLWISRILDVVTIILFLMLPQYVDLGAIYYFGVAAVACLLVYEHLIISPKDMSRIDLAFFKVNSIVASVAFLFTFTDIGVKLF